ncbi:MAG TPA: DUF3696 domain-containing protein [Parafilimonas sp.]|nr:DUF3696 domain-containing protein [Parafilimonas sp.]
MRKKLLNIEALLGKFINPMSLHSEYQIRWKNYKCFLDTEWITIKPITILLGNNNSGKTSFISPLLLMNQTLSSRDSNSPLVIKGNLYDGGSFKDISLNFDTDNDIFFGFRYHMHEKEGRIKKIGTYSPGAFEVTIGRNKKDNTDELQVKRETIYDLFLREYLSLYQKNNNEYALSGLEINENEKNAIKKIIPINFLFTPNTLLNAFSDYMEALEKEKKQNKKATVDVAAEEQSTSVRFSKGFEDLLRASSSNFSQVRNVLMNLSYVGPLREIPHRYYEISDEDCSSVGQKGENTAALVKRHFNKINQDLNFWIKRFEFGDKLLLDNLSSNLYSLQFVTNKNKSAINIANCGFGASQILPLIVQALVSDRDNLTIAEQPEIHLNPRLQGILAELFVFMAKRDQRIIVETHSEHLLLRLRTLIAKKEISPDLVAVYFIEKKEGYSQIRAIPIDENGRIASEEWPKDFFEDTLRETLQLASEQAKNKKIKK